MYKFPPRNRRREDTVPLTATGVEGEEQTLFSFCQMMKAGVRSPLVTLQVSSSLECLSTTRPVSLPSISVIESEQNIIIVLLTKYFSSISNFQYSNRTTILLNLLLQNAFYRTVNMFELKYTYSISI